MILVDVEVLESLRFNSTRDGRLLSAQPTPLAIFPFSSFSYHTSSQGWRSHMSDSSPPRSPLPAKEDDDDDVSFGRSTRSQIRLKPTKSREVVLGDGRSLSGGDDSDDEVNGHAQSIRVANPYQDDPEDPLLAHETTAHESGEEASIQGEEDEWLSRKKIHVGTKAWDDSEDESDEEHSDGEDAYARRRRHRIHQQGQRPHRDSYLHSLTPSRQRRSKLWRFLTNPGAPNTLSVPHVAANLFSASLHPSVLLSTPFYFDRTGILLGTLGLAIVAILGGVGGGLWVVLSRYVGQKKTVESITGSSFGKHSKWKSRIGKAVAGIMLGTYATGSAFIAYFGESRSIYDDGRQSELIFTSLPCFAALADLLLQLFLHYSPLGIPLHDRDFVTLFIGGLFTAPLIIIPLHKRTLIRLATGTALFVYPVLIIVLLVKVYTIDVNDPILVDVRMVKVPDIPNANPLEPPSLWAPYSLLPLLTLSSSPLQILAHNRSLRRKQSRKGAQHGSNVKAFLMAQALQVVAVVGVAVAFGIGMGLKGVGERLQLELHPNLFASLPRSDHLINLARLLFVFLLSTHLALCLAVARSSWARLLKLFNIDPFKRKSHRHGRIRLPGPEGERASAPASDGGESNTTSNGTTTAAATTRQWPKLARTSLGGLLLWLVIALAAFISGVGGIRRKEKEGEAARYVRASEILGLFGGGVGFVLPGLVWIILFHVRRPRGILPNVDWVSERAREWVRGDLGILTRKRRGNLGQGRLDASESSHNRDNPVPTWSDEQTLGHTHPPRTAEQNGDEATRILLARKERQLQKRTKERRIWQDILVLAAVLPCGIVLLVMGAIELSKGGF